MDTQPQSGPPDPTSPGRLSVWRLAVLAGLLVAAAAVGGVAYWHWQRPSQRFARALAALDAKRWDEVKRELAGLERAPDYEPQQHFLRGALLVHAGKPRRALEELAHTVHDPELRVPTLVRSGEAFYRIGDLRRAIHVLSQAVEADAGAVDAHRWLASAYYDLGLVDAAAAHLIRVAELDPADPRPHRLMGLIQKDFEKYAPAVESYRESLRRSANQPDGEEILLELAECQIKLREHDAALETLAEAPPSADRWVAEAECHYGEGRSDEAKRLLEQALEQSPVNLRGLMLLATILLEERNAAGAVELLTRAVIGYPKEYAARFKLAQAYRRLGDAKHADEHAAVARELDQLREEFAKLHKKANLEPNNADVRCRLGQLARQLDRPDLARVWFRSALQIDPRHEEARRSLRGGGAGGFRVRGTRRMEADGQGRLRPFPQRGLRPGAHVG